MKMKRLGEKGQALTATVVVVGAVALIFIAAIVYQATMNSTNSTKSSKSINAYELAQAAVQKGIWALNLQTSNWGLIQDGGVIPGFDGTTVHTDIPGGKYKILITKGPEANQVTIDAYTKDNSTSPQYRGLQVVLAQSNAQFGPVMGYQVHFKQRVKVHWGPIYSYDFINLEGNSRLYYPQLYSMGKITPFDSANSPPNTDGVQWWGFDAPPGVPPWPQIDFAHYKALAQQEGTYYAKGDRANHIRHKDDDEIDNDDRSDDNDYSYHDIIDTQPYVRFFDDGVKVKFKGGNNMLLGVIIAMDRIEFRDGTAGVNAVNAKYAASDLPPFYPHTVSLPQNAWKEYQKIDTASPGDYPGDIGGPGASGQGASYTFGAAVTDNLHTTATFHFLGFLYGAKKVDIHRGGVFLGVVMSPDKNISLGDSSGDEDENDDASYDYDCHDGDGCAPDQHIDHGEQDWGAEGTARHLTIFYQDNLGIATMGPGVTQQSWQEIPVTPF
ncbi:MAG: hypothetical protein ACYCPQ_01020 [Elusimicrobiota bacterium]